jgi:histidinol-phosphate phosphatase family protein
MSNRPIVFLDRDGTIIRECHYLSDPDQVELLPGVSQGLQQLQAMGLRLVVLTNQSAIGRGYFDLDRLQQIHQRLQTLLLQEGIHLTAIFFCPHVPQDRCHCRKPNPGLIEQAAQSLKFSPSQSFVVGDKPCDIELGLRIKATTFLVRTGYGIETEINSTTNPHYVVNDLSETAQVIQTLLTAKSREVVYAT